MDDKEENQALGKHGLSKEELIISWQTPTCRSSVCVETDGKGEMEQDTLHRNTKEWGDLMELYLEGGETSMATKTSAGGPIWIPFA